MSNELVLVSSYESITKILEEKLKEKNVNDKKLDREHSKTSTSTKKLSIFTSNEDLEESSGQQVNITTNTDIQIYEPDDNKSTSESIKTKNADIFSDEEPEEEAKNNTSDNYYADISTSQNNEDIKEEYNKENNISKQEAISSKEETYNAVEETNELKPLNINIYSSNKKRSVKKKINEGIHKNLHSNTKRLPSTLWKFYILNTLYSIIKKCHYEKRNTKYVIISDVKQHNKQILESALKDIGIENVSSELISESVLDFFIRNGKLDSDTIISERELKKNLNSYKVDKDIYNNNMLLFLMIYLAKKLEDKMVASSIYPSSFKKRNQINSIIHKFNTWQNGIFNKTDDIKANTVNAFIDSLRKSSEYNFLDAIINL